METYNVLFLQEAMDDLEEIVLYIGRESPAAAHKVREAIVNKAKDLSIFPRRGRLVPDNKMAEAGYRMLLVNPYIIFYKIAEKNVFIYRIIHGATDYSLLYERM